MLKSFYEYLLECTIYSTKDLIDLEKFADRILKKLNIDIEFTHHFGERLSDKRNEPCIKITELQQLFKKIKKEKGLKIKNHKEKEAVLVDIQNDLNLPFVITINNNGEFILTLKTIMRKQNFRTSDKKIFYGGEE